MSRKRCSWCRDANAEGDDGTLCRMHVAEYEGLSVAELDRMEAEQFAEWYDAYYG